MRGFTVADMDKFTLGMLINYCHCYDRIMRVARGETVINEEKQYTKLQAIRPLVEKRYREGKIAKEQYDRYTLSLHHYEGR